MRPVVVIQPAGPGEWRVGTRTAPGGEATWVGTARNRATDCGLDHDGTTSDLRTTVDLLIRLHPAGAEHDTDPFRLQPGPPPPPRVARPWERATAAKAKSPGRTLGEMASPGRGAGAI